MENLTAAGLDGTVRDAAESDRPFLGICVGMQILFEESEEFGPVAGLGILSGRVRRFAERSDVVENAGAAAGRAVENARAVLKIPHMGWNQLHVRKRAPHLLGIEDGEDVYFVHSYYVDCGSDLAATTTPYGGEFVSSVWRRNLFAVQFHPEKSQRAGLRLLENFARLTVARPS